MVHFYQYGVSLWISNITLIVFTKREVMRVRNNFKIEYCLPTLNIVGRCLKLQCYSITDYGLICIDVYMTEWRTAENKWSLGHCYSSHKWVGAGTYIQKCCLSEGTHILTCKTSRHNDDWSSNVVIILGHRFCEDFVGYEEAMAINISGLYNIDKCIYVRIFCFIKFLLLLITNSQ